MLTMNYPPKPRINRGVTIDTSWMDDIDTTGIDVLETLSGENHVKDILDFLEGLVLTGTKVKTASMQPSTVVSQVPETL